MSLKSELTKQLKVPDYQRDYAWGADEATDFIEDLIDFVKNKDEKYLFGQFIYYRDENEKCDYIIDGQQRIITSTIFLSVCRNIVDSKSSPLDIDRSEEDYLKYSADILYCIGSEKNGKFNLTIKGNARSYFEKNIQRKGGPVNRGKYRATQNMKKVYDVIDSRIKLYCKDCINDEDKFYKIKELTDGLLSGFTVSEIITTDLSQAYTVFETLNSRGKDLDASDLLKNYFFQKSGCYSNIIKNDWNKIDEMLDESKLPVAHFVRSFWNSGHNHVRKNQLYREISKSISNEEDIKQFVDGLLKVCPCYIDLNNSGSGYFKDHDIQQSIQGLSAIGAKIFYPTILACVYKEVDAKIIKILLKTIESLFIRNIVIGPENANSYEESFSTYGKKITEDSSATSEVIEDIKSKIRSDEAFKNDFRTSSVKTSSTARYILTTIYNYENGKEIRINSNPNEVQVEHIMPKSNDKWKVDKEIHSTYLYYIGNQTLLLSSDNTEASNDTFDIKKIIYNRSTLKQNSEYFKDIEKWTTDEIKNRQEELCKTAVKCWLK